MKNIDLIEAKLIQILETKEQINKKLMDLPTGSLAWDKQDLLISFLGGISGAMVDFLMVGKSYNEPGTPSFLKEYDLKNNPIDNKFPGASAGDHRLYSYGHDLSRISKALKLMKGEINELGIHSNGGILEGTLPDSWDTNISTKQALVILLLHLYKDYFTARSLPIPGSTLLAELNGDKMPEWLEDAYIEKEFNLKTVTGQAISAAIPEIVIRLYIFLRFRNSECSKKLIDHKKNELLLLSHSIVSSSNISKSIFLENPALVNYGEILRVLSLATKLMIEKTEFTNNLKTQNHLIIADNLLDLQMNQLALLVGTDELDEWKANLKKLG